MLLFNQSTLFYRYNQHFQLDYLFFCDFFICYDDRRTNIRQNQLYVFFHKNLSLSLYSQLEASYLVLHYGNLSILSDFHSGEYHSNFLGAVQFTLQP